MGRQQHGKIRTSIYWALAVFASIILFVMLNYKNISSTTNQVKIGKRSAESIAATYWYRQQVPLKGYERTALLQVDATLDGYLSLYHLDTTYQKRFSHLHPVQYWEVTYYKQGQTYQYVTRINPTDGTVVGFSILNVQTASDPQTAIVFDVQGSDQSLQAVQLFAEKQLAELKQNVDITYVIRSKEQDATQYIFQAKNTKIGQAPLRVEVEMFNGSNRPKGFATSFVVPQADKSWFRVQSERSEIMTWIFMIGQFLLFVAACVVLYRKRRQGVRYGTGFWLIVLAFFLDLLVNLNSLPALQSQLGFSTLAQRNAFLANGWIAFFIIITSVLEVGMLYFMTVAGGALSKDVLGDRWLSFKHADWPQRVRSAAFRGYALAIIWLGLQSLFYYIGQTYFHVWEQNDTSSSPWNNVLPALMPVTAWFAGINEELTFRLFGYALFKSWFKNKWLAFIMPAMIWALGHSLYPVYPIYTRFIELTIFGALIGWCMLKWNLETVIFAHISFDVILISLSLLSDQPVSMLPAAFVWGASPLLVGTLFGMLRPVKLAKSAS